MGQSNKNYIEGKRRLSSFEITFDFNHSVKTGKYKDWGFIQTFIILVSSFLLSNKSLSHFLY